MDATSRVASRPLISSNVLRLVFADVNKPNLP